MNPLINVVREQIEYFYLIIRLSFYELKMKNKANYLGGAWEIINPGIQMLIYWFVFGTLRERAPVVVNGLEIPFFIWLISAFFLWIFIYQSLIDGSKSIYSRLRILSKMNFPLSVIPNIVIVSKLYIHFILLGISIVILSLNGFQLSIYSVQIVYILFSAIVFLFAVSLITSTLSTIARDFHMFLNSILRMFLYISGVLWPIAILKDFPLVMNIMKLNPLYYLIEGYRKSFFGSEWFIVTEWKYTLYFWLLTMLLLYIGSKLHVKFRRHLIDYL